MQRLTLSLALVSASLLACGAATVLPSRVMAFELDTGAVTDPGGTTRFGDPDEKPLPAPLPSARLEEDGTSLQTAPGMSLQIAPGTSLQIGAGPGLQIAPGTGLQMAPMVDSSNPADNRTLIPRP